MRSKFLDALAGTQLYPITDRGLSGLSHAEQVVKLAEAGAKVVQLRDKTSSPLEFYREAEAAVKAARQFGLTIIINDRVDIAKAVSADGVHLGQDDLPPQAAREILGNDFIIGFSTHNVAQATIAAQLPVDYLAMGPIFPTTSKVAPEPTVGLEILRQVQEIVRPIPLVAIGGITLENRKAVLESGAHAVAIISEIWGASQLTRLKLGQFLQAK